MKKIILIIILLTILFSFKYNFSALEIDRNVTRQEYFGNGLGKIYKNRFGVYFFTKVYPRFMKFESSLFSKFESVFIYMPIFGLLIYLGSKQKYEK